MIAQYKACVLGDVAVGKADLLAPFVTSVLAEKYQATVGVQIHRKEFSVDDRGVRLILWEFCGTDETQGARAVYLRGSSGIILVLDRSRRATVQVAWALARTAQQACGPVPMIVLANQTASAGAREVTDGDLAAFREAGIRVFETTSATRENVEDALHALARAMLEARDPGSLSS